MKCSYTSAIQSLNKAHHNLQYLSYMYLTTPSHLLSSGLLDVAVGTAGVELEAVD